MKNMNVNNFASMSYEAPKADMINLEIEGAILDGSDVGAENEDFGPGGVI